MINALNLVVRISRAFPSVTIWDGSGLENFLDDSEFRGCLEWVKGKSWSDLEFSEIEKSFDCIGFMPSPLVPLLLPAFLMQSVVGLQKEDVDVMAATWLAYEIVHYYEAMPELQVFLMKLSREQYSCLLDCLQYCDQIMSCREEDLFGHAHRQCVAALADLRGG